MLFPAAVLLLLAANAQARAPESFAELHARAREVEKRLMTLRADFVETTESDLLADPIVERGTMIASRPLRVLLRYEHPERKALLIDGDRLRMVWFERGKDETLEIGKIQDAVDKYFYRVSEEELRKQFDVAVALDPELPGTRRVDMIPRRKQVQKGIDRIQLWITDDTLYLARMRIIYPGGVGSKTIELSNLLVNTPIDDEEFRVETGRDSTYPRLRNDAGAGHAAPTEPHPQ